MKVAITQIGSKMWTGRNTYLKNLAGIINKNKSKKIDLYLLSSSNSIKKKLEKKFRLVINLRLTKFEKVINFFFSNKINEISHKYKFDLLFESTEYLGLLCKTKIITWLPDFQHKYYPENFGFISFWKREFSYWLRIKTRERILVSSIDAKKDCIKFYKVNPKKIYVAPFSIDLKPSKYFNKRMYLKKKYNIIENYFYVPNQFWIHKNHNIIFKFIDKIQSKKELFKKIPQFILTGLSYDNRNYKYSQNLKKKLKLKKYKKKIKYLGLVPLEDVYTLNANSLAVINPSFFEGWSTTVEEAKSLGTKMILSDIKIHREQSPKAIFFNPYRVKELENCILNFIKSNEKNFNSRQKQETESFLKKRGLEFSEALTKAFSFK